MFFFLYFDLNLFYFILFYFSLYVIYIYGFMDLKTVQENQRTYWGFAKHRIPTGFTHHMTPGSIHQLLQLLFLFLS